MGVSSNDPNGKITHLGVVCHEMGYVTLFEYLQRILILFYRSYFLGFISLYPGGLPDLYDADYSSAGKYL